MLAAHQVFENGMLCCNLRGPNSPVAAGPGRHRHRYPLIPPLEEVHQRYSAAITLASVFCPLAMFYCVVTILIAKPGTEESADPLLPFLFLGGSFGLAIAAMLVPLLAEFDVALGRTAAPNES